MPASRTYVAIDLKSFYASVECVDRGLNPLTTNLVVADKSRTDKTICLAVSPSLKAYGIGGRARLFEVVQRLKQVNDERREKSPKHKLTGKSVYDQELKEHPDWEVDYLVAPPRMGHYITYSTRIYNVYLKYIAPEDIHVYSIDEVIMDVTDYLESMKMTAHELAMTMIRDVLATTGITATAGIGSNMYLCKVAMDIVAKHIPADKDGVRIAELDEQSYREKLWEHTPLTDFWRIGRGIANRLETYGLRTMGDIARISLTHENFLYKLFGINAELIIDHAWGYEPVTMAAVKAYRPETRSLSSGQVLTEPYDNKKAGVVVREMAENMALDLLEKHLVADQLVLTIGYDIENLTNPAIREAYHGDIATDHYGRQVPKHS
ncbi:MAG: DNA methylase, partial [Bacteroidales bacterium]|nr:DNA methylase [Bacteroidales bacterium]